MPDWSDSSMQRSTETENGRNIPFSGVLKIRAGRLATQSEVYKCFHSTSPNFTPPPKIARVCDESHPSAEEACLTVWFLLGSVWFAFPFGRGQSSDLKFWASLLPVLYL